MLSLPLAQADALAVAETVRELRDELLPEGVMEMVTVPLGVCVMTPLEQCDTLVETHSVEVVVDVLVRLLMALEDLDRDGVALDVDDTLTVADLSAVALTVAVDESPVPVAVFMGVAEADDVLQLVSLTLSL